MPYVRFMSLVAGAKAVVTDSGGVQEETTYLGIPCLTLRENTERPITISQGTNRLVSAGELVEGVTHYTFAHLEQRTLSMTLRLNYTAKPNLTFEMYAEPSM